MKCTTLPLLVVICLLLAVQGFANRPDTANPYFEINRLMGTMAAADHISFTVNYYYEESGTAGRYKDTIAGKYQLHGTKFFARLDSTVIIQNELYNLSVNKESRLMILGRTKTVFPAIMSTNVLDAKLQSSYVVGAVLSDSANYRKIKFMFKNVAPYASYELVYDTITYRTSYISYRFKHYGAEAGNANYYTGVKVVFSNYQTGAFTDSVFDTTPYINRVNGVFLAQAPYNMYEIINQLTNQ